ncbi:MAG: ATP-dependent Clp protease ATP-binding subunit [Ruminococcaceae bacterium]|nr:ATP-dependent Clp protease ATP-binding subunit [Oscillospiraceae bacterium]
MELKLCVRCKKRRAILFITRIEGDKSFNDGFCLQCAKKLGIKQVDEMIDKLGIPAEEIDAASEEIFDMIESGENPAEEIAPEEARAPTVDFFKLFSENGLTEAGEKKGDAKASSDKEQKKNEQKRMSLSKFCIDLTAKARKGEVDKIIGRDKELERVMQILCRRQKNNPCLIGEPGVGKTAIAEALALRIVEGNVPYKLKNKEVLIVDMTAVVAGTQFRGQFENRMRAIIEEAKNLGNIILMIDEIHSIAGAGDSEGGMSAANILKPALSRGEIQIVGATTLNEYRKYIEKDSALERRFQPVIINEPTIEDSIQILMGIKGYYEKHHGINIPESIVRNIVMMSERYITERYLPDKAIDLMDETSSYVAMNSTIVNRIDELCDEIRNKKSEIEALSARAEKGEDVYEELAKLRTLEMNLNEEFEKLSSERDGLTVTIADLAKVIEIWTGIPASNISENEFNKIQKMEEVIKERIVGQDEAVAAVAKAIKRSRAGISYKKKPCSFIFAGKTGVGKTELVKVLASYLFDGTDSLIRLDMSEFMEKHSVSRLIGSPPGYVGYDEAGQLTEKIRRRPYSIILFDEIEKAHPDVLNVMLQILDDGHVTDSHGKTVNFENTVIVMTTNAGSKETESSVGFGKTVNNIIKDRVLKALDSFLRPEFINRIDEIIVFNSLTEENFAEIAKIMLSDLKSILENKNISLVWDDKTVSYLVKKGYSTKFGARNLRRLIQTELEDQLAEIIIGNYSTQITGFSVTSDMEKLIISSI